MNTHPPASAAPSAPWPSASRGWMVAGLLALASVASQADRTVVTLMAGPIKAQFGLSDTAFSVLQSVAFNVFYVLACIPIGRLADRFARRTVLGLCMGLFSLFSMASGLARSYMQLFLMRIGVGIGEASVTPASFSLLSDHFPPERLGRPISVFLMSAPFGQGMTLIAGGSLMQWLMTSNFLRSGLFSGMAPWQVAFIVVGFPGMLLVPALLLLREPARRGPGAEMHLSVREVIDVVRQRRAALLPIFGGFAMVILVANALAFWMPTFLERTYGLNKAQQGLAYGLLLLVCGTGGAYLAGWLNDRLAQRGILDAPLKVAAFSFVGCGVAGTLAMLMPTIELALLFLVPTVLMSTMPIPSAGTSIQLIVPSRARAQVSALYITISSLVGMGLGPMLVGLLNDYLFHDPLAIRYSLSIVMLLPGPLMFWLFMRACRPYRALRAA
jgi:MFS family permease